MKLKVFVTKQAYGLIWVFYGPQHMAGSLPWDQTFEHQLTNNGGTFVDLSDVFDVSYLRVMENLTDFHHVAHVHRNMTPTAAEVTLFEAHREGHHLYVDATLGHEGRRGYTTAKAHIVAPFLGHLQFPGIAQFAVIATPIDEQNTWLFARYSQTVVNIPWLNRPLTWLLGMFDYRLLQRLQDLPVWRSQRREDPTDISRYHLLEADQGVAMYFSILQELANHEG